MPSSRLHRARPYSVDLVFPTPGPSSACSSRSGLGLGLAAGCSSSSTSSPPPSPTLTTRRRQTHHRTSSMGLIRERSGNGPAYENESSWSNWDHYTFGASSSNDGSMAKRTPTQPATAVMQSPLSPTKTAFTAVSPVVPAASVAVAQEDVHIQDMATEELSDASEDDSDAYMSLDEDESLSSGYSSADSSCMSRSNSASTTATSVADEDSLPDDCFPSTSDATLPPSAWSRTDGPRTFPAPTPATQLSDDDLESSLRFANADGSTIDPRNSAPPAFFPQQRVSFAPQLKIKTAGGIPLAMTPAAIAAGRDGISGMMLGVTGVVEILDVEKTKKTGTDVVKSQRLIADFATDLTNGLRIWRRDAAAIVKEKLRVEREWRAQRNLSSEDLDDPLWEEMLAPGTFMLPLSMKIPCTEKLPPSFECAYYRIRYTMSLAIFGSRVAANGKPELLHVHSVPFHILPSTLPTSAPHIPVLTHDTRKSGFLAGLTKALTLGGSIQEKGKGTDKTCTHIVCPSIPTSTFSPGSVIPVTLRIADCPTEPTDLYVRLSLVRKIYVRDSPYEAINEWGLPDDMFFEEFCKEEEEIVSRWGYVPYSIRAREGAQLGSKAQVIISDITLPVSNADGVWTGGYSSHLDLNPTQAPSLKHGECSWFSPALTKKASGKSDYDRYVHTSVRHFISIEIGFASGDLASMLEEVSASVPDMEIPLPNSFTRATSPSSCSVSGHAMDNPFPIAAKVKRSGHGPFPHAAQLPSFPGKLKEIHIPVTIGSVAEPQMSCIVRRMSDNAASIIPAAPSRPTPASTPEQSAERAARDLDESVNERYERVRDDGEEAWLCPPPSYSAAVNMVPAYV